MMMGSGRAPFAPDHDRMMRPRPTVTDLGLQSVAVCEECGTVMKASEVNAHYNKTGHGTYNEKLLTSAQYRARFG